MTEREKLLLEIAKEALKLNADLGAKLTGSLMLAVRGINKRREASDIDIICEYLCEEGSGFPKVPKGFTYEDMDGLRSAVDSVVFKNSEGVKLEFMCSEEYGECIDGVDCTYLRNLMGAKERYAKNDRQEESRTKHLLDVQYIYKNNTIDD